MAGETRWLDQAFSWVLDAFDGKEPGLEPIDTPYHDREHTLQALLCLTRLLVGWHQSGQAPLLDARAIRLGTIAALMHDTGYLKDRGDLAGTGAKLTRIHVLRSAMFARLVLAREGLDESDIRTVEVLISCTGHDLDPALLPFENETLRTMGCVLGTADILGQMAAPDYLAKLECLHAEFMEAQAADPSHPLPWLPPTPRELVRNTPAFWKQFIQPRLEREYRGVMRFLNHPWPAGPNQYLEAIARHLAHITA